MSSTCSCEVSQNRHLRSTSRIPFGIYMFPPQMLYYWSFRMLIFLVFHLSIANLAASIPSHTDVSQMSRSPTRTKPQSSTPVTLLASSSHRNFSIPAPTSQSGSYSKSLITSPKMFPSTITQMSASIAYDYETWEDASQTCIERTLPPNWTKPETDKSSQTNHDQHRITPTPQASSRADWEECQASLVAFDETSLHNGFAWLDYTCFNTKSTTTITWLYDLMVGTASAPYTTIDGYPHVMGTMTSIGSMKKATNFWTSEVPAWTSSYSMPMDYSPCSIPTSRCSVMWQSYLRSLGLPASDIRHATEPSIYPMPSNRPRCSIAEASWAPNGVVEKSCLIVIDDVKLLYWPPTPSTIRGVNTSTKVKTAHYGTLILTSPTVYIALGRMYTWDNHYHQMTQLPLPLGATKDDTPRTTIEDVIEPIDKINEVVVDLHPDEVSSLMFDIRSEMNPSSFIKSVAISGLDQGEWGQSVSRAVVYSEIQRPPPDAYFLNPVYKTIYSPCSTCIFDEMHTPLLVAPSSLKSYLPKHLQTCRVARVLRDPPSALSEMVSAPIPDLAMSNFLSLPTDRTYSAVPSKISSVASLAPVPAEKPPELLPRPTTAPLATDIPLVVSPSSDRSTSSELGVMTVGVAVRFADDFVLTVRPAISTANGWRALTAEAANEPDSIVVGTATTRYISPTVMSLIRQLLNGVKESVVNGKHTGKASARETLTEANSNKVSNDVFAATGDSSRALEETSDTGNQQSQASNESFSIRLSLSQPTKQNSDISECAALPSNEASASGKDFSQLSKVTLPISEGSGQNSRGISIIGEDPRETSSEGAGRKENPVVTTTGSSLLPIAGPPSSTFEVSQNSSPGLDQENAAPTDLKKPTDVSGASDLTAGFQTVLLISILLFLRILELI